MFYMGHWSSFIFTDILIESQIYSVFQDIEVTNPYDTGFGYIYDWVACNPLYNRFRRQLSGPNQTLSVDNSVKFATAKIDATTWSTQNSRMTLPNTRVHSTPAIGRG